MNSRLDPGAGGSPLDSSPRLRVVGTVFPMITVALVSASCGGSGGSENGGSENAVVEESTSQGTKAPVSSIVEQPEEFPGQTVTVSGQIALVPSPGTFMVIPQETYNE